MTSSGACIVPDGTFLRLIFILGVLFLGDRKLNEGSNSEDGVARESICGLHLHIITQKN